MRGSFWIFFTDSEAMGFSFEYIEIMSCLRALSRQVAGAGAVLAVHVVETGCLGAGCRRWCGQAPLLTMKCQQSWAA